MRSLLQFLGAHDYPTPADFFDEASRSGVVRRPLQNLFVAQSCAASIASGLVVYLAHNAARCQSCCAMFPCYRCGARGRLRGRKCGHCVEGVCDEPTGGSVVYRRTGGDVVTEPFRAAAWRARQPALEARWRATLDGAVDRHPCQACGGTGRPRSSPIVAVLRVQRVVAVVDDPRACPAWATPDDPSDARYPAFGSRRRSGTFWLVASAASLQPVQGAHYSGPRFRGVRNWRPENESGDRGGSDGGGLARAAG